jgi:hypothetical protein
MATLLSKGELNDKKLFGARSRQQIPQMHPQKKKPPGNDVKRSISEERPKRS